MGNLLQLFAHGCGKWVTSCMRWEVGGWQAPSISACICKQVLVCISSKTRPNRV